MLRTRLIKSTLVATGVGLALLVLEVLVRIFNPQIFERPPGMFAADPDVGYVLEPGSSGTLRRSEFQVQFTTGPSGLRGIEPRPRQANTFRILVLGDSQAWGFGVSDEQTFSARLEGLLLENCPAHDIQVLNGGVPGYGTVDQLAFLNSRGAALDPDLVVVQFLSVNDLEENLSPARTSVLVQDGKLIYRDLQLAQEQTDNIPAWLKLRDWLKRNFHLARLAFDMIGYLGTRAGVLNDVGALWGEDYTEEEARLGVELLVQIAQSAGNFDASTLFLYTTGQAQVIQDTYERARSASIVEEAAGLAKVPWIDASEEMQARQDRYTLYYARDGHWTPAGHQAIAEILADHLIPLGLILSPDQGMACDP